MDIDLKSDLGREILEAGDDAFYKLRSSGQYGIMSFVKACVEDGDSVDFFIEEKAVAIGGEEYRQEIHCALQAGLNRFWVLDDGHFWPIEDWPMSVERPMSSESERPIQTER